MYSVGSFGVLFAGLLQVAVLTRLLPPAEFGSLALLLVFSALLTLLYNLVLIQGVFVAVFGAADGEVADAPREGAIAVGDRKRALGTGLVGTLLLAGIGTAVIAPGASWFAAALGTGVTPVGVLIAAGAGAAGSLWRLLSNVPRLERRPGVYVALQFGRPMAVLAAAAPLAALYGVEGVVAGIAGGTTLACLWAAWTIRSSITLAFDRRVVIVLVRRGAPLIPVMLAFTVIGTADVLLLSRFVDEADVGVYRVASRVAVVASYVGSGLLMAWGPLSAAPLWKAAERRYGEEGVPRLLVTYFGLGMTWLVLAMAVAADLIVRIAPSSYSHAAALIPILAASAVFQAGFIVVYRAVRLPRKALLRIVFAVLALGCFVGLALALIPMLGGLGAALASALAFVISIAAFVVAASLRGVRVPVEARHLAAAVVIAAVMGIAERLLSSVVPEIGVAAGVAAIAGFPVVLIALGIVPRSHVRHLVTFGRRTVPSFAARRELVRNVSALDAKHFAALEAALPARLDRGADASVIVDDERFVRALRACGVAGESTHQDRHIGEYLRTRGPIADRDGLAAQLVKEGADPVELAALEDLWRRLNTLPRSVWRS